jgi:hypothetical protein
MPSRTLPIEMAQSVAFASLAPARKLMLCDAGAHRLTTYVIARAACERQQVKVICGDNRFDPYAVARFAKSQGVRPAAALNSIRVARAFTAYQMVELINRLALDTLGELVVISGPCATFFDDDVALVDAARLFYRALWRIAELAGGGMTLLLAQSEIPANSRRTYFLTDLCRACDVVLRLGGKHTFALENRRRVALPYLAALDGIRGE